MSNSNSPHVDRMGDNDQRRSSSQARAASLRDSREMVAANRSGANTGSKSRPRGIADDVEEEGNQKGSNVMRRERFIFPPPPPPAYEFSLSYSSSSGSSSHSQTPQNKNMSPHDVHRRTPSSYRASRKINMGDQERKHVPVQGFKTDTTSAIDLLSPLPFLGNAKLTSPPSRKSIPHAYESPYEHQAHHRGVDQYSETAGQELDAHRFESPRKPLRRYYDWERAEGENSLGSNAKGQTHSSAYNCYGYHTPRHDGGRCGPAQRDTKQYRSYEATGDADYASRMATKERSDAYAYGSPNQHNFFETPPQHGHRRFAAAPRQGGSYPIGDDASGFPYAYEDRSVVRKGAVGSRSVGLRGSNQSLPGENDVGFEHSTSWYSNSNRLPHRSCNDCCNANSAVESNSGKTRTSSSERSAAIEHRPLLPVATADSFAIDSGHSPEDKKRPHIQSNLGAVSHSSDERSPSDGEIMTTTMRWGTDIAVVASPAAVRFSIPQKAESPASTKALTRLSSTHQSSFLGAFDYQTGDDDEGMVRSARMGNLERETNKSTASEEEGAERIKLLPSSSSSSPSFPPSAAISVRRSGSESSKKYVSPAWYDRLKQLREYKREQGDCMVPQKYAANPSLGIWVNKQR